VTVWCQLASAAWALNVTMQDPAPVVGLSPRDPLNGFAGLSACQISSTWLFFLSCVLMLLRFHCFHCQLVSFSFLKKKIRSRFWFQLFSFDEWVSLPLRELPGMMTAALTRVVF